MTGTNETDGPESMSLYEREPDETPAEAVVTNVAAVLEQSPLEMKPLYESVDPDVLNSLFDGSSEPSGSASVTFDYCGLEVTIDADGVWLAELDPDSC